MGKANVRLRTSAAGQGGVCVTNVRWKQSKCCMVAMVTKINDVRNYFLVVSSFLRVQCQAHLHYLHGE